MKINHKKAVFYEKNEVWDWYRSSGAECVYSEPGKQAIWGRTWWNGDNGAPADPTLGGGTNVTNVCSMEQFCNTVMGPLFTSTKKIRSTNMRMRITSASTNLMKLTIYVVKAQNMTELFRLP